MFATRRLQKVCEKFPSGLQRETHGWRRTWSQRQPHADTVSRPVFLPTLAVKSVYASSLQHERVPHGSLIERKQHQSSAGPKAFK